MFISHIDSTRAKVGVVISLLIVGLIAALYLAGYFFLVKLHNAALPPSMATPYTVIDYWTYYGDDPYTRRWLMICFVAGCVPTFAGIGVLFAPLRRSLHGDARFATRRELERAGLFDEFGLILGQWGSRFVMLGRQMGAICAAPPRSGKGAGLVQPNALNWWGSFIVLDIRKECWRITSGWRTRFSDAHLFDPLAEDGCTAQWNPLSYVRDDPALRINDLQKLGNMLSPDSVVGDPFWPASCRDLLTGLGLYVLETASLPRTMGEIMRQIMHGEDDSVSGHWKSVIEARDAAGSPLSNTCKAMLYDFISLSGPTQSSVRKTFTAKLQLWANPLVDAATSGDSFDLSELRRKKISIYVGVNPGDLGRLSLLLNLFFTQMFDLNMREMPEDNVNLKYELLALMDEFTSMGRMPIFPESIGSMGGYGIRPFVIVQSLSQLRATYGPDIAETIITCCGGMVVYAPKEQKHAEDISKMLGNMTVKARSRSRQIMSGKPGSVNLSDAPRPLMNAHEVKQIGKNNEIIFVEGVLPIFCKKIWYWKLLVFKRRSNLSMPKIQPIVLATPAPHVVGPKKRKTIITSDAQGNTVTVTERAVTPSDIDQIDNLPLVSYAADFKRIALPKGASVTDGDLTQAYHLFLSAIDDEKEH